MLIKTRLIVLLSALFFMQHIWAAEIEILQEYEVLGIYEVYECTIDTVYDLGSGKSTDRKGGTLIITIINKDVNIKSNSQEVGDGSLKLVARSDVEIVAINKSMQFTYKVKANKFNFTTGNGQSRFRGGVGHVGEQKLTYGKCSET